MHYSETEFNEMVEEYGEVFVVLDSGEQYEIHGKSSYDVKDVRGEKHIQTEGIRDSEYLIIDFPLAAVEHLYTHREV